MSKEERRLVAGAGDGSRSLVVVVAGDVEVIVLPLDGLRPDLALVDALARLQVAARRRGRSLELREPCRELCELLELVGLADVIVAQAGSAVEAEREAEGGEELGVQEVVQPRDTSV
jgi:hypothetical protein